LNTRISSSNDEIPVIYDLTDGAGAEIPEISYKAAIGNKSEDDDEQELRGAKLSLIVGVHIT